jgi:hypothetical protein
MSAADDRDRPAPGTEDPLDPERKERVLHTRIPESLERELKQRARGLGMSVSTVVRHVLLNTFGLVEDIVADSTNLALAITGQERPARDPGREREGERARDHGRPGDGSAGPAADSGILGWQEAVLNLNAVCERCNDVLRKGSRAAVAVRDRPGPRAFLCPSCLAKLAAEPNGPNDPNDPGAAGDPGDPADSEGTRRLR